MLTPTQVVPFLGHDDPLVRHQARAYFRDCPDAAPLTADDLWPLIDRFRGAGSLDDEDEALSYASLLAEAPLTEPSLRRLLREIGDGQTEEFDFHYQQAVRDVGFELLRQHRDVILSCPALDPKILDHLQLRLDLADEPLAVLYQRLMDRGWALRDASIGSFNASETDALTEAVGRHGAVAGELAVATLADSAAQEDWREIFAVRVVGEARYEPAIAELVRRYDRIDDDLLGEEVNIALQRIGTSAVVEQIVAYFPGKPWEARVFAYAPLEHIKRPESEAALLKLAGVEDDKELRAFMLGGLCNLGSLAGLDLVRKAIAADPDDLEMLGVLEALLAVAVMNGVELPEAAEWRNLLKNPQGRRKDRFTDVDADLDELGASLGRYLFGGRGSRPAAGDYDDEDDEAALDDIGDLPGPGDVTMPIRREAPKVGRNDPCPCGSGKKYKKCCGKN